MNKHFEDSRYYIKRAGETAKKGVAEELEPIQERIDAFREDDEPEPSRLEEIKADLKELQGRAEGEAKEAIGEARGKLEELREKRA